MLSANSFTHSKMDVKRTVLESYRLNHRARIPEEVMMNLEVEQIVDHLTRDLVVNFSSKLFAEREVVSKKFVERCNEEYSHTYCAEEEEIPMTLWDHFKLELIPEKLQIGFLKPKTKKLATKQVTIINKYYDRYDVVEKLNLVVPTEDQKKLGYIESTMYSFSQDEFPIETTDHRGR